MTSFLQYMQAKKTTESNKSLLGVSDNKAANEAGLPVGANAGGGFDTSQQNLSGIAGILGNLVRVLEEAVSEVGTEPGEWIFNLPDTSLIEKICLGAGMTKEETAVLLQNLEENNGNIGLEDFLGDLKMYFERLAKVKTVTVPETDLPLLEAILNKMGVDIEEIQKISEYAVNGDDQVDLALFLEGLINAEKASGQKLQAISLTPWEAEQLQDILSRAGVSEYLQNAMFSEGENQQILFGMERLKAMLTNGVAEVESSRKQADVPVFMNNLFDLLAQAGFDNKSGGWSPVVLDSIGSAYKELLVAVDKSTVQIKNIKGDMPSTEEFFFDEAVQPWFSEIEDGSIDLKLLPKNKSLEGFKTGAFLKDQETITNTGAKTDFIAQGANSLQQGFAGVVDEPEIILPQTRLSSSFQQQVYQQLTESVSRGLKNNEHHLVLKLYPPELGEVKVDLFIRDEKVSVSFNMENNKVKQIMENNMEQFRSDMEQRGFDLEDCNVSVGQHDTPEDAKRHELAWHGTRAGQFENLSDLPEDVLYLRAQQLLEREGGVSLFV
ncbi:MAG: flagellar hook-length control protein FliK [Proteobacteria bacterium]|nr:flagellar hook-length control protein FliK [Pseudomonadota bacterium]MBU1710530.1 flagellar hook-length control protein FliK [Pseudomonadota bacterium]